MPVSLVREAWGGEDITRGLGGGAIIREAWVGHCFSTQEQINVSSKFQYW